MGAFIVHLQSDQRILAARFKETRKPLYKHMQNAPPMTRKKEAKPTDIAHKSTHPNVQYNHITHNGPDYQQCYAT